MKKNISLVIFLIICDHSLYSQNWSEENGMSYGIKAGATYSSISNLETTILAEPFFQNYTLKKHSRFGWTGGMFLNYMFTPALALETEIMYAQQGGDLFFNDTLKDFNYKMKFRYQYINVLGQIKLYPWGNSESDMQGFSVGVGPQLGLNIAPQNIIYTSWGKGKLPQFGSDLDQQQQIRNVLKGKNNFGFSFGLGWEFRTIGVTIDARYHFAVTDAVETQSNSYNFIENKNTSTGVQFTVGWDFSSFNPL